MSSVFSQDIDRAYSFPVKPGSVQWKSFRSVEEMYRACQIPVDILSNLSTKALIQTCLDYPAPSILLIHNTPQQGFDEWKKNFNGVSELLKRASGIAELISTYKSFDANGYKQFSNDIDKGKYTFLVKALELIIVQA